MSSSFTLKDPQSCPVTLQLQRPDSQRSGTRCLPLAALAGHLRGNAAEANNHRDRQGRIGTTNQRCKTTATPSIKTSTTARIKTTESQKSRNHSSLSFLSKIIHPSAPSKKNSKKGAELPKKLQTPPKRQTKTQAAKLTKVCARRSSSARRNTQWLPGAVVGWSVGWSFWVSPKKHKKVSRYLKSLLISHMVCCHTWGNHAGSSKSSYVGSSVLHSKIT